MSTMLLIGLSPIARSFFWSHSGDSALAVWSGFDLILLLCGIVFLFEALSVVLQVGYFKLTGGKRLFKMAPFHHHLEKCSMSENRIVCLFCVVTTLFCVAAFFAF